MITLFLFFPELAHQLSSLSFDMLPGVNLTWRLFNPDCLVHILSYLAHLAVASLFCVGSDRKTHN